MLLWNTRRSGFNVKSYEVNYFNAADFPNDVLPTEKAAWVTASGNQTDGSMYAGRKAVRAMVVAALKASIDGAQELREEQRQYNLIACPNYEELGLNLRSMVGRIVDGYLTPRMAEIEREFTSIRSKVEKVLGDFLDRDVYARSDGAHAEEKQSFLGRLLKKKAAPAPTRELPEISAIADWQAKIAAQSGDDLEQACLTGLHLIVSGIVGRRGRLLADKQLVLNLATNWVCNSYGSSQLGILIQPIILEAAKAEGFRLLPYQAEPFIMNVKGASGAGKSTIRPLQRELAGRLGISWEDFALISPDYWRK